VENTATEWQLTIMQTVGVVSTLYVIWMYTNSCQCSNHL